MDPLAVNLSNPPAAQSPFVFVDPLSRSLLELARRVAATPVSVLITGPTGTGKEVLARIVHQCSPQADGPFVALNCAALPETLIEDLLFGHERGAFTGAHRDHAGVFEQANGGTLFLDEIAEMPVSLQARLLRVLQERQVTRLGAQQSTAVSVRLLAATNRDLRQAMRQQAFREDLYYRISTFPLRIPPLAERPGDILPLAMHLLQLHGGTGRGFTPQAAALLGRYTWPGNVRELSNVIQRAMVLATGPVIDTTELLFEEPPSMADTSGLGDAMRTQEHQTIVRAINSTASRLEAARLLGISPRTLRHKIATLRSRGYPLAETAGV